MSAGTPRERWLRRATIVSAVLAALSYGGGPIACATTKQVEMRKVRTPLYPGHDSALVLTRAGATGAPVVERIERGALIELQLRPGAGASEFECTLAGFDPVYGSLLITQDGDTIEAVPQQQLYGLTVLGEKSRSAHAANGALIGGLTGLALGAALGAEVGGRDYGALCAVVTAIPVGGLGTGIGAGIGALARSSRARTEYPLGPSGWWIANRAPVQPAAAPPPTDGGGTP